MSTIWLTFIVFNNEGYGEIASAMKAAGAQVLGCTPRPLQSPRRNPGPA